MSQESFDSLPEFNFDPSLLTIIDHGLATMPLTFRSRNTVSLSSLTRVEPKFQKELLAALNKVCPGSFQLNGINSNEVSPSRENLRCRSSPAVCSSHKFTDVLPGSPTGLSSLQNVDSPPSVEEPRRNKIIERVTFLAIIISMLLVFAVLRIFG